MKSDTRDRVFTVADQLLLQGQKPTQQAIRQIIGSGSLTTINRALNDWWVQLGARLSEQGKELDLPDPVLRLSTRLWNEALSYAQHEYQQRLATQQSELDSERESLSRDRIKYINQITDLNNLVNSLRAEIEAENGRVKQLRSELQQAQDEAYRAQIALTRLEGQQATNIALESDETLLESKVRLKIQQEEIDRLRAVNLQLSTENAQLKQRLKGFESV